MKYVFKSSHEQRLALKIRPGDERELSSQRKSKNVMLMFSLLLGCKQIFVNGRICSVRVCVCVCPHTCMNERAAAPQHQQQVWTGACTNLCASSGMYVSDATRQQVFVSACLLAGDTVCECVYRSVSECACDGQKGVYLQGWKMLKLADVAGQYTYSHQPS